MATASSLILLILCFIEAGDLEPNRWANLYALAAQQLNRGDFESVGKTAEHAYRHWSGSPGSYWYWPFRLILAESLNEQDRLTEATPLLEGPAPNAAWEARRLVGVAYIKYRGRHDDEARHALDSAEAINPLEARTVAGRIDLIRGTLDLREEQPAEAEACFRRALKAVRGTNSLVEAFTLIDLGVGDVRSSRNDEAVALLEPARSLSQRLGAKRAVMLADFNLGVSFQMLGNLDRALQYLQEAAPLAEQLRDHVNLLHVLIATGETTSELGDNAKAEEYLEKARRLASPKLDDEWLATILDDLSIIALAGHNRDGADRLNREAADVVERLTYPRQRLAQKIQAAEIASARGNYPVARKLFAEAIAPAADIGVTFSLWQCHAGLASIYRQTGNTSTAQREYQLAVGIIENERSKLEQDDFKLSFLSHLIPFYRDYVDFLFDRGDRVGAFRVAQSSRALLLAEKEHKEPAVDVKRLQWALQASGSILLSYWLAPKRSFLWVMNGTELNVVPLPAEDEIASRVRQYADAIQNPLAPPNAAGQWLFSNLIPPAYRAPKAGNIVIQPDGALHELNFESLPTEDARRYWIEDATVSIAPSLALLGESAVVPQTRLLLFGDPDYAASDLPKLPNLKAEIDAVSAHYSDKALYMRDDATPASYGNSHPERYSTLHFAAHAEANRESPLDSAIILAGPADRRKLYARDISAQSLTAELVTLSACRTAGSRAYYGEGLMGFSWAFLSAGARNVVAGLWQVDDRATARLMAGFYQEMAKGQPPAVALRQAKMDLMESSPIYRRPLYWAAFETFTSVLHRSMTVSPR